MRTFKSLAYILLGITLVSCDNEETKTEFFPEKNIEISRAESESMSSIADFSMKLLKSACTQCDEDAIDNFVIAPFNLATSLAMIGNAADQEKIDQLLAEFNMENDGIDAMNQMFEKILTDLPELDSKSNLLIANSIWTDIDTVLPEWYVEKMETSFKAPVNIVEDMKTQESADSINKWIESATNGLLDFKVNYWSYLAEKYNVRFFVTLNTLYFKGLWREKFEKSNTKVKTFHNADGTESNPKTMTQRMRVGYQGCYDDSDHFLGYAVRLPYGNNSFGLNLFLPYDENVKLNDFVNYLSNRGWEIYVKNQGNYSDAIIELPRFEINTTIDLHKILKNSGSKFITDSVRESLIFFGTRYLEFYPTQMSSFKVDEEGSEAVSVTHNVANSGDIAAAPIHIQFNRPFIFVLSERSTGAILMAGRVNKLK